MIYSKEDCIESLRAAAEETSGYLSVEDYRGLDYSPSPKTMENKFGSWKNAKEAAELDAWGIGGNGRHRNKYDVHTRFHENNYHVIETKYQDETYRAFVHRLLAVAEFGIDAVKGKDVHHKSGHGLDNRHSNLELRDHSDHSRLHSTTFDAVVPE